jgi:hypothetical protein
MLIYYLFFTLIKANDESSSVSTTKERKVLEIIRFICSFFSSYLKMDVHVFFFLFTTICFTIKML